MAFESEEIVDLRNSVKRLNTSLTLDGVTIPRTLRMRRTSSTNRPIQMFGGKLVCNPVSSNPLAISLLTRYTVGQTYVNPGEALSREIQ